MKGGVPILHEKGEDRDHYAGQERQQDSDFWGVHGDEVHNGQPEQSESQTEDGCPEESSQEALEIVIGEVWGGLVGYEDFWPVEVVRVVGGWLRWVIPEPVKAMMARTKRVIAKSEEAIKQMQSVYLRLL